MRPNSIPVGSLLPLLWFAAITTAEAAITVIDDTGQRLELQQPARRIVSLSPHITELLFAAGAADAVVGVSEFSDYPPAATTRPRVSSGAGIDIERLLELRPDLVIAWHSGNSMAQVERLEQLGLPVFRSEPRMLDDIATSLERFGRLAGTGRAANRAVQAFRAEVNALRSRYAGREPVNVFYQIGQQPLMTVNGEHIISHWLQLCGARNLFADLQPLVPVIDSEAVLAADPQAIIADWYMGRNADWKVAWQRFSRLRAVRTNALLVVPDETLDRQTPRAATAARRLCERIDRVRQSASAL